MFVVLTLLILFTTTAASNDNTSSSSSSQCELITVSMCRPPMLEYNMTSMPNQFNHVSQQQVDFELQPFWPLVQLECARELRFFLCSMYTPICLPNYRQKVTACRSVCERARLGCERFMVKLGFEWPEYMNCDHFPEYGSDVPCMDPVDASTSSSPKTSTLPPVLAINKELLFEPAEQVIQTIKKPKAHKQHRHPQQAMFIKQATDNSCPRPMIHVENKCLQPCHSIYFTSTMQRSFAYYWLLIGAVMCFASTLLALFISSTSKNESKPIVYVCLSYVFVSVGYLLRFIVGHERMACDVDGTATNNSNATCSSSFVLVYYFQLAAALWWLVLTFKWFRVVFYDENRSIKIKRRRCKSSNGSTALEHFFAWFVPAVLTIVILGRGLVDADTLTGVCSVGNLSVANLRYFVIVPNVMCLCLGITLLLLGFAVGRQKTPNNNFDDDHSLCMVMYAIVYTVPATCVLACHFYEHRYRETWESSFLCKRQQSCTTQQQQQQQPDFAIFMFKYFMTFSFGIMTSLWLIWSSCASNKKRPNSSYRNNSKHVYCQPQPPIYAAATAKCSADINMPTTSCSSVSSNTRQTTVSSSTISNDKHLNQLNEELFHYDNGHLITPPLYYQQQQVHYVGIPAYYNNNNNNFV